MAAGSLSLNLEALRRRIELRHLGRKMHGLRVEIVQASNARHHCLQSRWHTDIASIGDMAFLVEINVVIELGMECALHLAGIAAEIDLGIVRIGAVDGESIG